MQCMYFHCTITICRYLFLALHKVMFFLVCSLNSLDVGCVLNDIVVFDSFFVFVVIGFELAFSNSRNPRSVHGIFLLLGMRNG